MNDETKTTLNTIFDVPAVPTETAVSVVPVVEVLPAVVDASVEETPAEREAKEDYAFSRGAIKSIAAEAQSTLHRAVEVAEQTDTPRSYEVVGELVRATLEAHRDLQSLHKTAAEIRLVNKPAPSAAVSIEKGIVFNGTAADLLKIIDTSRQ